MLFDSPANVYRRETLPIEPSQSSVSSDSEESILGLYEGMHIIGRKPVFHGEILAQIAAGRLARVECEPAARDDHDDDSTNRSWANRESSWHTPTMGNLILSSVPGPKSYRAEMICGADLA